MKRCRTLCAAVACVASVLLANPRPLAQSKAKAQNIPEIAYESVPSFFKMPPTIYKLELDGRIVGKFGRAGKLPKEFGIVNAIDCRSENELFVGELGNWRVQKINLRSAR